MMKLLVIATLLCCGLAWVHGDKDVIEGNIVVKVLGHSGKINIRQKGKEFNKTDEIVVDMEAITEIDSSGSETGKGNKHKVKSFASQEFDFSDLTDAQYGGLDVKQLTFTSKIVDNATLKVFLCIFKKEGDIVNDDEVTQVKEGTVKFNIELNNWQFCSGVSSDCNNAGSFVDFVISIKSKGKPETKDRAKSTKNPGKKQAKNYNLGNAEIQLSTKVKVDGSYATMADGYPKMEEKNKKQTFTFRFPKFNNTVVYDPAIDMTSSGANGGKIANMLNLFLVALCVAFVRFLA